MRKPRSDSKLLNLPEPQQAALAEWLLDGMSYAEARDRLQADFAVESSAHALTVFYQRVCAPLRLRRAADAANSLPQAAAGLMAEWDAASVALVKQRYFELLAAPSADPKELAVFAAQVAHISRGRMEREKLRFQRQKTAAALRMKRREMAFTQRKFETSAADLALKFAREIKTIAADRALRPDAKVEQVRQRLFGPAPSAEATATEDAP